MQKQTTCKILRAKFQILKVANNQVRLNHGYTNKLFKNRVAKNPNYTKVEFY